MNRGRSRISSRQLGALALSAAAVPVFRCCCRFSWSCVLPGGVGAAALLSCLTAVGNRRRGAERPAWLAGLCLPLLAAGALWAAWESSFAFPETAGNGLAAAMVLLLSLWAAALGPAAAGRCAGILLWITGALYGIVLLFSLPELRTDWLRPAGEAGDVLRCAGALLTPAAALLLAPSLGEDQRLPHWPWWAAALSAAAAAVVTGGILSPALAREPESFRTLARGVSVLGVIRRFEALVNGAMLISGFSLCVLYLTAADSLTEALFTRKRGKSFRAKPSKNIFEKMQKKC